MKCTQSLSQELSASGGKLVAMKCDVRKEEDILSMMREIKSQLGGADICAIKQCWTSQKCFIVICYY